MIPILSLAHRAVCGKGENGRKSAVINTYLLFGCTAAATLSCQFMAGKLGISSLPLSLFSWTIFFLPFFSTLLMLLILSAVHVGYIDSIRSILFTPLSFNRKTIVYIYPLLLIASVVWVILVPLTLTICYASLQSEINGLMLHSLGTITAIAIYMCVPLTNRLIHFVWSVAALASVSIVGRFVIKMDANYDTLNIVIVVATASLTLAIINIIFNQQNWPATTSHNQYRTLERLPLLIIQCLRNHSVQINMLVSFVCTTGLTIACNKIGLPINESLSNIYILIISSFVSDIRGIHNLYKPPEIVNLKGTFRYYTALIATALVFGLVLCLPYLFSIDAQFSTLLTMLVMGSALGVFSGTAVGVEGKNIASQIISLALGCTTLWLVGSVTAKVNNIFITPLAVAIMLYVGYLFEYKRNNFSWRKI